jgi:hypothetical protein
MCPQCSTPYHPKNTITEESKKYYDKQGKLITDPHIIDIMQWLTDGIGCDFLSFTYCWNSDHWIV